MKKSNQILSVVIAFFSLTSLSGHAQIAMNEPHHYTFTEQGQFLSESAGSLKNSVSLKAEKNFSKEYRLAGKAEWSTLTDNTLLCRFMMNDIPCRAFYSSNGKWLYTVSGYNGCLLNKDLYDQVKRVYYNSSIVYVNQIDQAGAATIYVVEVRDEKSIKKVRVQGDQMDEISEFTK